MKVILASAATAAVVSGFFLLFNGWRDRITRRKEKLFDLAIHLAKHRTDMVMKVADRSRSVTTLRDTVFLAEEYYEWLCHLYDKGKLPAQAREIEKQGKEKKS